MTHDYHNEMDPYAAQWLRNLIAAGELPPGTVDARSIHDVAADDVRGSRHAHWFSGLGGWPYALQLAGWDPARPVWTGSCPCQPFSSAGKGHGFLDERHLWPVWFRLIRECRPEYIFGEQVANAVGHGWFDLICGDLEGEGYAVGAAVLSAGSVGAPHMRQRLFWVADAQSQRRGKTRQANVDSGPAEMPASASTTCRLGHAGSDRRECSPERDGGPDTGRESSSRPDALRSDSRPGTGSVADGEVIGRSESLRPGGSGSGVCTVGDGLRLAYGRSPGPWDDIEWIICRDGKARPTQPGLFPLAPRIPGRVGQIRAAGNAIVPQVAAEFVRAFLEAEADEPCACYDGGAE